MLDVKKGLYNTLEADTTLRSLTGWTASDSRIYFWHPGLEVKISDEKPAYIIFSESSTAEAHIAKEKENYLLEIYSRDAELVEQIFAAIDALFNNQILSFDNFDCILIRRKMKEDIGADEQGVYGKGITYQVEVIPNE
jgi:hypothetical protein